MPDPSMPYRMNFPGNPGPLRVLRERSLGQPLPTNREFRGPQPPSPDNYPPGYGTPDPGPGGVPGPIGPIGGPSMPTPPMPMPSPGGGPPMPPMPTPPLPSLGGPIGPPGGPSVPMPTPPMGYPTNLRQTANNALAGENF